MLSERSQAQKVIHCMISFIWNVQNKKKYADFNQFSDYLGLRVAVE